ncbi:MAG: methyltransferase domain-containing protein [Planctomycetota bacterium]|nr:methyltransferase domain-containing protein [Planctomycetota bacterium]
MTDIHALPFDQYQRYRLVADLLEKAMGGRKGRVLDVGGRTELLGRFLLDHQIVLVDVEESDAKGLILGSGAALPFADDSFDAVCAFDTLEHVPVGLRDAFVSECARVSRGFVFLAGPYDSPDVARSEELLQEFLKSKIGQPHRYLNEHRELGLPDRERVTKQLEAAGGKVGVVGHANLERWLLSMCLEMYMESDPLLQPLAKPFYRFYNKLVYPHDHAGPVYRHVVMASFGGGALPSADQVLQAPALPAETDRMLQSFAKDWMCVDREHQVWKPEFERLTGIIADLEKDLTEHKQALSTGSQDLLSHKATLEAVRAELLEVSKASSEQAHDLNLQLQAHAEQAAHLKKTLQEQGEGSQEALQTMRFQYEQAMEQARVQGEAVQEELGAELARTQDHAGALEAERKRLGLELEAEQHRSEEQATHRASLEAELLEIRSKLDASESHLAETTGKLIRATEALGSWTKALGRVLGRKYQG